MNKPLDHSSQPRQPGLFRWLRRLFVLLLVLVGLIALGSWLLLRASLPALNGQRTLAGLGAEVRIERDSNGVPTIHAANRDDVMRALGFLHGQERFFEMDLLRRQSAGELAELFGSKAIEVDTEARRHRFRHRAAATLAQMSPADLRQLDIYTAGVNAGLAALSARPWEYLVLRTTPRPWAREDTLFVMASMTNSLQEHDGSTERIRQAIRETYDDQTLAFLRPTITPLSAALDGSSGLLPPLPANPVFQAALQGISSSKSTLPTSAPSTAWFWPGTQPEDVPGSNSFALAGNRVAGGSALVSNDMHLNLGVPNTWYRASLAWPGHTVTGVTLPGSPGVVVGSNGEVAWSFTNAYADTSDVILVERDPADPGRYQVPDGDGWERFEIAKETIQVAGHPPHVAEIAETRWGPLLTPLNDTRGKTYALRWVVYDPAAFNLRLLDLPDARNAEEAIQIAHGCGIPAQNFIVGERAGAIAWTIIGHLPKRVGFDGNLPTSWADGSHRWDGFLSPEDTPAIRNPPDGQLWTANNRTVGGEALARLGDGNYDLGARARQIRDRLTALNSHPATPQDGLNVQLDDEALFFGRWRDLLLKSLPEAVRQTPEAAPRLRELESVVRTWNGRADVDAAGYRLVRDFRRRVLRETMQPIEEPVWRHAPELNLTRVNFKGAEEPFWAIFTQYPAPPSDAGAINDFWQPALTKAIVKTARKSPTKPLARRTWGSANTLRMQHPFGRLLPGFLAQLINMPVQPLPGDRDMPRVQGVSFGASERMDVSPGHEAEGIFHQPGGASGNPLSPFYRAGHADWVAGRPTPFLPGPAKSVLVLTP